LHEVEGYQHHEIAELLDCSIGNSKSQLHKAKMKMRALLFPKTKIRRRSARNQDGDREQAFWAYRKRQPSNKEGQVS
jgi:hypothetical protein